MAKLDMREIGRLGGRGRTRAVLGLDEVVIDSLRAKAKTRMDEALDDPDPKIRLQAARTIASYSPERPPAEQEPRQRERGGRGYSIGELVAAAAELKILSQMGAMDETTENALLQRMKERGLGAQQLPRRRRTAAERAARNEP